MIASAAVKWTAKYKRESVQSASLRFFFFSNPGRDPRERLGFLTRSWSPWAGYNRLLPARCMDPRAILGNRGPLLASFCRGGEEKERERETLGDKVTG